MTYIPREQLEHAGFADVWPIFYRTWASHARKGAILIQLYPAEADSEA